MLLPTLLTKPLVANIQAGPYGVASMAAFNALFQLPITQYNDFYSDTVGYGLNVCMQGLLLKNAFAPSVFSIGNCIACAAMVQGARLGSYLLFRDLSGFKFYSDQKSANRFLRIGWALFIAFFSALVMSPVLFLLRNPPQTPFTLTIAWIGACLAWSGLALEATADNQKFRIKKNQKDKETFEGPTTGPYRLCRHPNYAGEMTFWLGIWLAGAPSFLHSGTSIVYATSGFMSICAIVLLLATRGTERKQKEKYQGQPLYEEWKLQVPSAIVPRVPVGMVLSRIPINVGTLGL